MGLFLISNRMFLVDPVQQRRILSAEMFGEGLNHNLIAAALMCQPVRVVTWVKSTRLCGLWPTEHKQCAMRS